MSVALRALDARRPATLAGVTGLTIFVSREGPFHSEAGPSAQVEPTVPRIIAKHWWRLAAGKAQ